MAKVKKENIENEAIQEQGVNNIHPANQSTKPFGEPEIEDVQRVIKILMLIHNYTSELQVEINAPQMHYYFASDANFFNKILKITIDRSIFLKGVLYNIGKKNNA